MIITTTIPYVNARPHIGFLLELVQADVLARHHRRRGRPVGLQPGTDDKSLKNVLAAPAAAAPRGRPPPRNRTPTTPRKKPSPRRRPRASRSRSSSTATPPRSPPC